MLPVQIASISLNQLPLDFAGNRERIVAALDLAMQQKATVLCFPELAISGYGCEDAFHSPYILKKSWETLLSLVPLTRGVFVAIGLPISHRGATYNAVAVLADGRVAGIVCKKFLAGDGIHYEPRWFKPWPTDVQDVFSDETIEVPIGDLFFDCNGIRLGFEICEEAWVPNRPGAQLARKGVDIFLNPSASHFAFGKLEVRKRFVIEGSRAFGTVYVYANLLGNESGRAIFDGGALVASEGKLLVQGSRLTFKDFEVTPALVDLEINRMNRARTASFQPNLKAEDPQRVEVDLNVARALGQSHKKMPIAPWEEARDLRCEEFVRATALALFDYLRKSHSQGFVVSLSGGVDSSVTAILVAYCFRFAMVDLGLEGLKKKLSYIPWIKSVASETELIHKALTGLYQSTKNSSSETRAAAERVAHGVGAKFHSWDIDPVVEAYTDMVRGLVGRDLEWGIDDLALQNIQARVRGPGAWFVANLQNALLLATSNRSEAAVGYATMDGDTSGGISPIAGVSKSFLRHWCAWLVTEGPVGYGPFRELDLVLSQPPKAELRPANSHQTDEDDLMPYEVLDAIELAFIRDKRSPEQILELAESEFTIYTHDQLKTWVNKFFRLWAQNQWKRDRYAPSFHLDDESLDPKTWCRFPILSYTLKVE